MKESLTPEKVLNDLSLAEINKEEALDLLNHGYKKIPDNWWEKARFL